MHVGTSHGVTLEVNRQGNRLKLITDGAFCMSTYSKNIEPMLEGRDYRLMMAMMATAEYPKSVVMVGGGFCTVPRLMRVLGYCGKITVLEPNRRITGLGRRFAPENMEAADTILAMKGDTWARRGERHDICLLDAYTLDGKPVYGRERYEKEMRHLFRLALSNTHTGGQIEKWE